MDVRGKASFVEVEVFERGQVSRSPQELPQKLALFRLIVLHSLDICVLIVAQVEDLQLLMAEFIRVLGIIFVVYSVLAEPN